MHQKHQKQESPEASHFPAGGHMAARHRQDSTAETDTKLKKDPQRSTALEWSVRKLLESLN